jgi:hypothetical protein
MTVQLPPYLETSELGRMPHVTFGPGWGHYEYLRIDPRGPKHTLTLMVSPPQRGVVNAEELAATVDRFWRSLWSSFSGITQQAIPLLEERVLAAMDVDGPLPDAATLLGTDRLVAISYKLTTGHGGVCYLTFNAYEVEGSEILEVEISDDFKVVSVTLDSR